MNLSHFDFQKTGFFIKRLKIIMSSDDFTVTTSLRLRNHGDLQSYTAIADAHPELRCLFITKMEEVKGKTKTDKNILLVHTEKERPSDMSKNKSLKELGFKIRIRRGDFNKENQPTIHNYNTSSGEAVWLISPIASEIVTSNSRKPVLIPSKCASYSYEIQSPSSIIAKMGTDVNWLLRDTIPVQVPVQQLQHSSVEPSELLSESDRSSLLLKNIVVQFIGCATSDSVSLFRSMRGDDTSDCVTTSVKRTKIDTSSFVFAEGGSTLQVILHKKVPVHSMLVRVSQFKDLLPQLLSQLTPIPEGQCVIHVCEKKTLLDILKYKNASGLGLVTVVPRPEKVRFPAGKCSDWDRILVLDGLTNSDNVGGLIRTAACFGFSAVVLSPDCCSPWERKSVRVSMGHVFSIPVCHLSDPLPSAMRSLTSSGWETYAAVVQNENQYLHKVESPQKFAIVVGSEHNGVSQVVRNSCSTQLKISMPDDVDSLNVGIAGAVIMNHFRASLLNN